MDADQRGVSHQRPERRHRLPAQVRGLQPGGHFQEDPLHPDVRGIHRPQVTQVCPAVTVRDLCVGLPSFFFKNKFYSSRCFVALKCFHFGFAVFIFYLLFFFCWNFYILYMNLYITRLNIMIFLCLIWMKNKRKNHDFGAGLRTWTLKKWLCAHMCECMCVCAVHVYACVSCCVNTITRSFYICDAGAKQDGNICF